MEELKNILRLNMVMAFQKKSELVLLYLIRTTMHELFMRIGFFLWVRKLEVGLKYEPNGEAECS